MTNCARTAPPRGTWGGVFAWAARNCWADRECMMIVRGETGRAVGIRAVEEIGSA